jgi:hypothetical protein
MKNFLVMSLAQDAMSVSVAFAQRIVELSFIFWERWSTITMLQWRRKLNGIS